jgi:Transposase, Mutator family
VVIDGSKALRAGVERVFGEQVEVQRCQIHKRRNVKEYLPENCQKDYDRRMRNAYAMNHYAEAKEALQKVFRQLERINPSAARSLEEGLEETPESVAPSAEGGPDNRSRLNLAVGRLTVPNIESRRNQLKLGHPLLAKGGWLESG